MTDVTTVGELGDPTISDGTSYRLCLWDEGSGVPQLLLNLSAAAGSSWTKAGTNKIRFSDPTLAGGIKKMSLVVSGNGFARFIISMRGQTLGFHPSVPPPPLPLQQDQHVFFQLFNTDGTCWGGSFKAPARSTDRAFRDQCRGEDCVLNP